jgi:D-tyrosyl-tRNA(Tyr) deacylase
MNSKRKQKMIAVLQRVSRSSVSVEGETVGSIGKGLSVLLGVLKGDGEEEARKLVEKILHMRIFADEAGKMNRSLAEIGGEMLVVSQFTLAADLKSGRRPSFDAAAPADEAKALYDFFISEAVKSVHVESGRFGADMRVSIENDGPVTIVIDSRTL